MVLAGRAKGSDVDLPNRIMSLLSSQRYLQSRKVGLNSDLTWAAFSSATRIFHRAKKQLRKQVYVWTSRYRCILTLTLSNSRASGWRNEYLRALTRWTLLRDHQGSFSWTVYEHRLVCYSHSLGSSDLGDEIYQRPRVDVHHSPAQTFFADIKRSQVSTQHCNTWFIHSLYPSHSFCSIPNHALHQQYWKTCCFVVLSLALQSECCTPGCG
jgi:hypothetical protein